MTLAHWTAVDRYVTDLLVPSHPVLEGVLQASADAGLPPQQVSPSQGKLLFLLARATRARTALEIGTLGGYSAVWLGRALGPGGRLVTLEADPLHAEVARANLARAGLAEVVDVRQGPALETLPRLAAEGAGPFDLVFLDADKERSTDYLAWALRLSRPGTLIVCDNVVRGGEVIDPSSPDPAIQGVRRLYEQLAGEPRVSATAIQTVGEKGHDGFALVLVTS